MATNSCNVGHGVDDNSFSGPAVIRIRQSDVDFDSKRSAIEKRHFFICLGRNSAIQGLTPFGVEIGDSSQIHLLLLFFIMLRIFLKVSIFVCRNQDRYEEIRRFNRKRFYWDKVEENYPLCRLAYGFFCLDVKTVSCNQDKAGDSVFSLGMIARFAPTVHSQVSRYPDLFWEAGMVGQIIYLEAEVGTGIGCFFDDPVHLRF